MLSFLRRLSALLIIAVSIFPATASAAIPENATDAVVRVVCANRQGSGSVIGPDGGFVLASGHVAMDSDTRVVADVCSVEFPAANGRLRSAYRATVEKAVFDQRTSRDFAVLKIGARIFGPDRPSVSLKFNEYAWVGDAVAAFGFPQGAETAQKAVGKITAFVRGTMETDAPIAEGYSGGPVLDYSGNIVGVATRIAYLTESNATTPTDYEMGDILSLINWLDEFNPGAHDTYLVHNDFARFHGAPYLIRDENPPCSYVVFTEVSQALSCLLDGGMRLVFPNEATYRTWYPDFTGVLRATSEQLTMYRLIGNMTMRPGSLIKIQTDPKTYLVSDSFGTLRHVPSEQRARELFGDGWAGTVRDVPDVFFTDYRPVQPLN